MPAPLLGGRYVAEDGSRPTTWGSAVRATRADDGAPVTVEVLDPRLLADPAARDRLAAGADALRAVSGRHLVRVREVAAPDGAVVHERFPGVSAAGLRSRSGGALPPERAAAVVADTLDGLAALHAAGLVHGALTEHDVLLDDTTPLRSEVRLTGFGLAALLGRPYGLPDVPGGAGTAAADVWAAGALLTLLAGPALPAGLAEVAAALQADDPDARPSAGAARDQLRAAAGLPVLPAGPAVLPAVLPAVALPDPVRLAVPTRTPRPLVLAGVALAVAVAVGAVTLAERGVAPPQQVSAALAGVGPTPGTPSTQSYAFPPLRRADGLVVRRIWTLAPDGRSLRGETVVTNPTDRSVRAGIDEVLPASVAAREQDVAYDPRPDSKAVGRAARYVLDGLEPGGRRAWTFEARLPRRVTTMDGLAALVADAEAARLAYEERLRLAGARVVQLTLSAVSLRVGESRTVAVSGRLADGRVLSAAELPDLVVRSSDPSVVVVRGTTARAVAPGAARLLAEVGPVRATGLVTVAPGPVRASASAAPGRSPSVAASPVAGPAVAPSPTRAPSPTVAPSPRRTTTAPAPAASPTRATPSPTRAAPISTAPSPTRVAPSPSPIQTAPSPTRAAPAAPSPTRAAASPPPPSPRPSPSRTSAPRSPSPSPEGKQPKPRPSKSPKKSGR